MSKAAKPSAQSKAATPAKAVPTATKRAPAVELFGRENFKWMLIGVAVLIVGFLLMAGGGSDDPKVFDASQVYSARRITIAPIVILIGLAIEIYAILRQSKTTDTNS